MHRSKLLAYFLGHSLRATLPCLGLAVLAASCSREHHASDEQLGQTAAAINANPKVSDFAIYAANSISLGDQSLMVGGDIGVVTAGPGPFLVPGFALGLGEKSQVNPARNLLANSVLLGENSLVGDIQTNHLSSNHATHGSVTPFVALPAFPAVSPVTVGTADLTVPEKTTIVLDAGSSFKNVKIGAGCTVRLAGGIYQMAQLTVGEKSRVEALATAEIHVAGRLSVGDSAFVGPTSASLTARALRIEVSGTNGGDGSLSATPVATSLGEKEQVRALVIVPNGTLQLGESVLAYGALFGRDVKISEKSQITFQDGFGTSGCPASCDDGNACTDDACVAGACSHMPKATGTACNDSNACTQTDTCQAGTCVGANPIACAALDQCHDVGTCSPTTGACSNPAKTDGTACNDGNPCTQTDTCQAGTCAGTNSRACTALDQCHAAGTCDPSTGACTNPALADGTSCNDDNACTQADACQAGSCLGANPVHCVALDQCHAAGTCDPSTGQCSAPAVPDGTACSDGNACTQVDVCVAGLCAGTNPVGCAPLDQCGVDPVSRTPNGASMLAESEPWQDNERNTRSISNVMQCG